MTRIYKTPFAATGDKEPLADTDPGTGKVSLPTGWTPDYEKEDTDPNYRPVGRKEMNGVMNEVTAGLGELQLYGFAAWQPLLGGWPAGAMVWHGPDLYMSTAANNATTPGAVGATWKKNVFGGIPGATFTEIAALTEDDGPIICTDMAGDLYVWTATAFFTGYRNPRSGLWYGGASDTPEAWELLATGGVWLASNPKHARVIARYREWGRAVAPGSWLAGWNHIADLGSGEWKAPDLRDVFQRMSGTDADTANAMGVGEHQADAMQGHRHKPLAPQTGFAGTGVGTWLIQGASSGTNFQATTGDPVSDGIHDAPRVSSETRGASARVSPVILV